MKNLLLLTIVVFYSETSDLEVISNLAFVIVLIIIFIMLDILVNKIINKVQSK